MTHASAPWAMGSLWDCLLGAGYDDDANLLLDLSKWLDDNPKFHGSPGCSGPFAKINSQTTDYSYRPDLLPDAHPLPHPHFGMPLLALIRGWGKGWGVAGGVV